MVTATKLDLRFGRGGLMICINRGDYYQCAFVIAKGGYDAVVAEGLDRLCERIARLAPYPADRVRRLSTWDNIKLLTVQVNQLDRWHGDGYMLIGDAATCHVGYVTGSLRDSQYSKGHLLRVVRIGLAVVVAAITAIVLVRLHARSPLERDDAAVVSDALPRLAFLRDSLDSGSAERMQGLFPEGYVFSYLLYGLTWVQVGERDPGLRRRAVAEARWALSHVDSSAGRAVFDESLDPAHGVFYVGWSSWLRGGIVRLSGERDVRFEADVAALAQAFERHDSPFLPAYPGQAWPCDSMVAMAAVRLGDSLNGTDHSALAARWLSRTDALRDPATGLLPHTAEPGSGARATSQVIILRFLPELDPGRAVADWRRFKEAFGSRIPGMPGIREYPRGVSGSGDVDSGPLPLGLGFSASAVALGDAAVYGDARAASALMRLAEVTGIPVEIGGRRRYAAGALPIGDAFLAWSVTAKPLAHTESSWPAPLWRLPWYQGIALLWVLALVLLRRSDRRSARL